MSEDVMRMFARHPLEALHDKLMRKLDQGKPMHMSAAELDWFVVSGAYGAFMDAVAKKRFEEARARIEASGGDLSFLNPRIAAEGDECLPPPETVPVPAPPLPDIVTPKMLAERWGLSITSIYKKIKSGELEHFLIGNKNYRIRREVVEVFEQTTLRPR